MIDPNEVLRKFYGILEVRLREAGLIAGKSGRHMKFPYTMAAKISQFPYFFYLKNNWIWRYYPLGILFSIPIFAKIHNIVNSESNVREWAETQRKLAEKEHAEH